jgi:hypothetical protein
MQDIIWKVYSHSDFQKAKALWKQKFNYCIHKSPPLKSIVSQPNVVRPIDPYLPKMQLNFILPPTPKCSQLSLKFGTPNRNPEDRSPLPYACHLSRPPQNPCLNLPNDIRGRILAMKFNITKFSPWSIVLPFRSKYSQHSLVNNRQSMFLPQSVRTSFAPIQHWQKYSFVYFHF